MGYVLIISIVKILTNFRANVSFLFVINFTDYQEFT
jgi:hypothetical protein